MAKKKTYKIWGAKTLLANDSALRPIHVKQLAKAVIGKATITIKRQASNGKEN